MTESEWLACTNPKEMLQWLAGSWQRRLARWCGLLAGPATRRKLWLFAAACCVRSTQGVTIPEWDAELQMLVALGKGQKTVEEFEAYMNPPRWDWVSPERWAIVRSDSAGKHKALKIAWDEVRAREARGEVGVRLHWDRVDSEWDEERKVQCALLRDILGNPFRPVTLRPAWFTWNDRTVLKLAQGIADELAFERLPVLGDALEEAGCSDEEILSHLRGSGPHVRGCWAVDLLLTKA